MASELKYGENPHQQATFEKYASIDALAISNFKRADGAEFPDKETSWISITDLGRLILTAERFAAAYRKNVGEALPKFAVVVKHGSPCGAAFGDSSEEVAKNAWSGDPQAAFGGFFLCTFPFTKKIADAIKEANGGRMPYLSIAASSIENGIEKYVGVKSDTRYFIFNDALAKIPPPALHKEIKSVRELILEQEPSKFIPEFRKMDRHGAEILNNDEGRIFADLSLAFAVCSGSNSNTVTLVKNGMLVGNAVGQQKRVGASRLALELAKENGHDVGGSVAVSDSFFPFPDGLELLSHAGVKAIFATSGSLRDAEVYAAAEKSGVTFYTVPDQSGRMFAGH